MFLVFCFCLVVFYIMLGWNLWGDGYSINYVLYFFGFGFDVVFFVKCYSIGCVFFVFQNSRSNRYLCSSFCKILVLVIGFIDKRIFF